MAASPNPLRVVVADDEANVRDVLRMSLQLDDGFVVVGEAQDGEESIRLVKEEQPDILVLDLRMPGIGGLEALPRIREVGPNTQIVVLSALPEAEMGGQAIAAGADGYLEKGRAMADLGSWLQMLRLSWEATHGPAPVVVEMSDEAQPEQASSAGEFPGG